MLLDWPDQTLTQTLHRLLSLFTVFAIQVDFSASAEKMPTDYETAETVERVVAFEIIAVAFNDLIVEMISAATLPANFVVVPIFEIVIFFTEAPALCFMTPVFNFACFGSNWQS